MKVECLRFGRGKVRFFPTSWEQMPTQFHIVSALAALPQLEAREAWLMTTRGGGIFRTSVGWTDAKGFPTA